MTKTRRLAVSLLVAVALALTPAAAAAEGWDNSIVWTGQGADADPACGKLGDGPYRTADGWIHWNLTSASGVTEALLVLGGSGGGYEVEFPSPIDPPQAYRPGGVIQFFTPYFDLSALTATVYYNGSLGVNPQLVVSDYCPGAGYEELTVQKTANTAYTRTHFWDIAKQVETENGFEVDGSAKIWLFADGHGDETATWVVDVTYEGYEDGDFSVSGTITIENTGTLDAVITGVVDLLGGDVISVAWSPSVVFPHTLAVGETLTGTYGEAVAGKIEGKNEVTVTTEEDVYSADAGIVWGKPATEINGTVAVKDHSELYGEVTLGTVSAPNDGRFTYAKGFAWLDYGAGGAGRHSYDNTATIVETGQSASATLLVNVQGFVYETAYAKGDDAVCFIPTFAQWGWTNPILPGDYEWDLWAGAGRCDTSKGTLVGSVAVVYDGDGHVTADFDLTPPYSLDESHVYAGLTMFPQVQQGKARTVATVAPGRYTNEGPFDGSEAHVIVHAVVGMPDPSFGP